ncbi:MAG: hypothetical protein K1060chlam4_00046 [Candidatus Anoxychlamydiales bacterium]|nr:hypothetical protein [Candidatus Anoxychlamydiales bacterium]
MKRLILFILLIFSLNGCFKNPIKTGAISEENRINLSSLAIGMTQQQVLDTMGYPYKTEEKVSQNKIYEVWYYITERTLLGQSKLITRNFTPVVFEAGHVIGWGNNFYKYTFDIDDERQKREEEKRQKYTNDKGEWPKNEHTIIAPLNEKKSATVPEKVSADPAASTTPTAQASAATDSTTTAKIDDEVGAAKTNDKTSAAIEIDVSQKESKSVQSSPVFEDKPSCCTKKAVKTNACDKCKTKTDTTKVDASKTPTTKAPSSKESDSTKEDKDKSAPCKDREDKDDGYNFWE